MELSPQGIWWANVPRDLWTSHPGERADILTNFDGEFGDSRQELVFIGQKLDEPAIRAALEMVLMTDVALTAGPDVWSKIRDPLPEWPIPRHEVAEHLDRTEV